MEEEKAVFKETVTKYIENEFIPKFMDGEKYDKILFVVTGKVFFISFIFSKRNVYFYRFNKSKYRVNIKNNYGKRVKTVVDNKKEIEETFIALNKVMKTIKLEDLY
jgi:hypothetical protein